VYYQDASPLHFDPEGLLSTLPAIANALAGVLLGSYLLNSDKDMAKKCRTMAFFGLLAIGLGELWGLVLPINKALWTSSYVVMSSGWAMLVLAGLIWLLDLVKIRAWSAPFVVFGANAISFYMFSAILARILIMVPVGDTSLHGWLYQKGFQPLFGNYNGSLLFAVSFCILCYGVMHYLYKRRIFLKV